MSERWPTRLSLAALALLLAFPVSVAARTLAQKKALALDQFKLAQQMREELSARPANERTERAYARTIAAFRKVYFITPNSSKADASIAAMSLLLAEEGRAFSDHQASREAIKQYRFLMEQYPGSRYKTQAMFAVGKIYQEELQDGEAARQAFEDFLKAHPRHPLSPQARAAIAEIDAAGPAEKASSAVSAAKKDNGVVPRRAQQEAFARDDKSLTAEHNQNPVISRPASSDSARDEKDDAAEVKDGGDRQEKQIPATAEALRGRVPVTGIRHWSVPDYTRVVIDLGQEVKYEAGRIPSPERIFFDLDGTRLAPELRGKSFAVGDGFLKKIRVGQYQAGMTRVVLEVAPSSEYSAFLLPNPERLIIDVHGQKREAPGMAQAAVHTGEDLPQHEQTRLAPGATFPRAVARTGEDARATQAHQIAAVHTGEDARATQARQIAAAVDDVNSTRGRDARATQATAIATVNDEPKETEKQNASVLRSSNEVRQSSNEVVAREASPEADGQRTLIRTLGLKIGKIVVDAGHGGHDTGTVGEHGLMEKDLVLDVAMRLGKLLERKLGAQVVYTRSDDTFVPLEERTAIANQAQADLFISVHANSSHDPSARGIETYYLNFTSSPEALEVAARENATSEQSVYDLQDLVKKIALKDKVDESREFAADVDHALRAGLSARGSRVRDRGVKKAPFIVLIGARMPSILAEISFLSNPQDERKLRSEAYRERIAESLYRGVTEYVRGLSGIKMAAAR